MSQHPDRCLLQYVACALPSVRRVRRCFRLVSWVTTTNCCNIIRNLRQLFNGRKSSRESTSSVPLLRVLTCYRPDCFFREHYLWYICALPTPSTIVLDVSVPGLLSSIVRLYIMHHISFTQQRQQKNMRHNPCHQWRISRQSQRLCKPRHITSQFPGSYFLLVSLRLPNTSSPL